MRNRPTVARGSLWKSLVSILLVLWFVYLDKENTSPGEITAAHAQDTRLLQSQSCGACHGAGPHSMTDSCLVCSM